MRIEQVHHDQLDVMKMITTETIKAIYPHYYAKGPVDFFLAHHNDQNITKDIQSGYVYGIVDDEEQYVGTVTIKKNEICRLFVLPNIQKRGFGRALMDFAEEIIGHDYDTIQLDASLPAKSIYSKRGYTVIETHALATDGNDFLCYDVMQKSVCKRQSSIHYDGKIFVASQNSANGEVSEQTIFHYHQEDAIVWASYSGGEISKGYLLGTTDGQGNLDFTYQHVNDKQMLRIGKCKSKPILLENGKLELHEQWQWLDGEQLTGSSIITEK